MIIVLLSCAHRPEAPPPDLASLCAETWTERFRFDLHDGDVTRPADCCADPERQAWADGLLLRVAEVWVVDLATVQQHIRVRHVEPWGVPSRWARLQVELRVGWATVVYPVNTYSPLDHRPASGEEAVAAFRDVRAVPPKALLDGPPRAAWRIERDLTRCADELGLPQPSFWCDGGVEVTVDGLSRHEPDVCFGLHVTLPPDETGWASYARGRSCAWDGEPFCNVTQGIRDDAVMEEQPP